MLGLEGLPRELAGDYSNLLAGYRLAHSDNLHRLHRLAPLPVRPEIRA